jgi:hypothetical protein
VYVVLRIDQTSVEGPVEDCISAVSVFRDQAKANAEVDRLNDVEVDRLNDVANVKSSRYIVIISRLKGEPALAADRDR